jgi:branched-chain amino acid transport system substrate-binding protein
MRILKACGDDVSRENILRQATSMKNVKLPLLLSGVTVNTDKDDYLSFQQLRLRRFNGKNWEGFGELLDDQ